MKTVLEQIFQKKEIVVLHVKGSITKKDLPTFKDILKNLIEEKNNIVVSMGVEIECSLEWCIANILSEMVVNAAKQQKTLVLANLSPNLLCKANQLKIGAKTRIFCQENAAITFLANAA